MQFFWTSNVVRDSGLICITVATNVDRYLQSQAVTVFGGFTTAGYRGVSVHSFVAANKCVVLTFARKQPCRPRQYANGG